jgi:hypothetical protein
MDMLDFKHAIGSKPYRLARRLIGDEVDNDQELLILGIGAAYTAAINLVGPFALIQSGVRGERYFSGLATGYSKLGYPMPLFNYSTPWSRAERIGARVGGRIHAQTMYNMGRGLKASTRALTKGAGYKIGARIGGRLIPGVGWALLAYDVYDIAYNRSLWGFDLS